MQHIGMVGTTYRLLGQEALSHYVLAVNSKKEALQQLQTLHQQLDLLESVYLATCNRVELIFVSKEHDSVAKVRKRFYDFFHTKENKPVAKQAAQAKISDLLHAYEGEGAAEHLFAVASSLDAMTVGESQILGQVKQAYRTACDAGLVGPLLRMLFEQAFETAKKIRQQTQLGTGTVSLVSLVKEKVVHHLTQHQGDLVVLGAGEMAEQCGQVFADSLAKHLLFVNRSIERAEVLAKSYGCRFMALQDYLQQPTPTAVLMLATAATSPVVTADFFERCHYPYLLCIDLTLQRNVDPLLLQQKGLSLVDLDSLQEQAKLFRVRRQEAVKEARLILQSYLDIFHKRYIDRQIAPYIKQLRAYLLKTLEEKLPTQQFDEPTITMLLYALAHGPTMGLKQLARQHGLAACEAFIKGLEHSGKES